MDVFCEHLTKQKKTTKDLFFVGLWIFLSIVLTAVLFFITTLFASPIAFTLFVALDFVVWYGCYVLVTRRNVEYELILTNGDFDVDAVYAKKRRVHILSVRVRDFEICAPVNDNSFKEKFANVKDIKRIYNAQSNRGSKGVYFADFYYRAQKVRLIFEPSVSMIKKIKIYNDKNVFLEGDV